MHNTSATKGANLKKLLPIILLGFVLVTAGVIFYIMNPPAKLIRIINPTHFEAPEDVGKTLAERLFIDLRDRPEALITLGIHPELPTTPAIWAAFQTHLQQLGLEFSTAEPTLEKSQLEALTSGPDRIIIAVPSSEEFHSQTQSLPAIRFWTVPYNHVRAKQRDIGKHCDFRKQNVSLECRSQRIENTYYRKRLEEDRYSAMLEKISDNEYALYIYNPQATQRRNDE